MAASAGSCAASSTGCRRASIAWDAAEKARCGLDGVAFEVFLQIDLEKRKIVLDKLFKYADMDFHLFTELLEILQRHFPDCDLVVPSLQGYELAREIRRFLGVPEVECVFLKGDTEERLLMGDALQEAELRGHPGGYTEALRGAGRRGEEEAGTGAGQGAFHVLAGEGRRRSRSCGCR